MKKSFIFLFVGTLVLAAYFANQESAPVTAEQSQEFESHQRPHYYPVQRQVAQAEDKSLAESKSPKEDTLTAPKAEHSSLSPADQKFARAQLFARRASQPLLRDSRLGPILSLNQSPWRLVENYEARLTNEERREGQDYLGSFALHPNGGELSPGSSPLVYNPRLRRYGVITGQLVVQTREHLGEDCYHKPFHGHRVSACFPHLSLVIVKFPATNIQHLQKKAEALRKVTGVKSVEIEILSHFQERL